MERLRDPEVRRKFREEHVPQWKLFGVPKGVYPEYPEGIEYVIVNGERVVEKGEHTGTRPGQVLRKTAVTRGGTPPP